MDADLEIREDVALAVPQVAADLKFIEGDYATFAVWNFGGPLVDAVVGVEFDGQRSFTRTVHRKLIQPGEVIEFDLPPLAELLGDEAEWRDSLAESGIATDGLEPPLGITTITVRVESPSLRVPYETRISDVAEYVDQIVAANLVQWPTEARRIANALDDLGEVIAGTLSLGSRSNREGLDVIARYVLGAKPRRKTSWLRRKLNRLSAWRMKRSLARSLKASGAHEDGNKVVLP